MIMEMFKDISLWALVTSIFLGAFTTSFVAISNPYVLQDSDDHPLTVPVWAMLGQYDKNEATRWNPNVGAPLLGTHLVIAQIILVNLLIAMMGDTYVTIKETADETWKFGRLFSAIESKERMSEAPPPLNLPWTLTTLIKTIFDACCCASSGKDYKKLSEEVMDANEKKMMSLAKKAKQKVAKKLLRKLKLQEEKNDETVEEKVKALLEKQLTMDESLDKLSKSIRTDSEATQGRARIKLRTKSQPLPPVTKAGNQSQRTLA